MIFSVLSALLIIIILLIIYLLISCKSEVTPDPRIPEEPYWPIVGHLLSISKGSMLETFRIFHNKYGPITHFRVFGDIMTIINDPKVSWGILNDLETWDRADRHPWRNIKKLLGGDVVFAIGGDPWRSHRRALSPFFSPNEIKNIFQIIFKVLLRSQSLLMQEVQQQQQRQQQTQHYQVDIDEFALKATLDVICAMMLGVDGNALGKSEFGNNLSEFFGSLQKEIIVQNNLRFLRVVPLPWRLRFYKIRAKIFKHIEFMISERQRTRGNSTAAPVDKLLESGMSVTEVRTEIMGMLFAGHETTGHTIAFAIYEICKNPTILQKIRQELDAILPDNPTFDDFNNLTYTKAVLNETVRLYPTAPSHPVHALKDTSLFGYHIPKDSIVMNSIYITHREKRYWGEDAEDFVPERFLNDPPTKISAEETARGIAPSMVYQPFLAGPHVCLGKHLAQLEQVVFISLLLKSFDFHRISKVPVEIIAETTLHAPPKSLVFEVKKRVV